MDIPEIIWIEGMQFPGGGLQGSTTGVRVAHIAYIRVKTKYNNVSIGFSGYHGAHVADAGKIRRTFFRASWCAFCNCSLTRIALILPYQRHWLAVLPDTALRTSVAHRWIAQTDNRALRQSGNILGRTGKHGIAMPALAGGGAVALARRAHG